MAERSLRGVCLQRTLELGAVRLRVLDWPGYGRPLICLADPFAASEALASQVAHRFAPTHRVVAISPRSDVPYQVALDDVQRAMRQFGFRATILLTSGHGACLALPLAAWYSHLVEILVLVEPRYEPPQINTLAGRSLCDSPPDWPRLRDAIQSQILTNLDELAEQLRVP